MVITPEESARLDTAASDRIPELMERAGLAVALAAAEMGAGYGARVAVLAGPGNNGGDGYVAARYLARRGAAVTIHAYGYPKGDDSPARRAAVRAVAAGVAVVPLAGVTESDLVIDALFGAGFHGELPVEVAPWTEPGAPVLAVDVPSGLSAVDGGVAGAAFTADRCVTFHALKVGHLVGEGPDRCGRIDVVDIGLVGGEPALLLTEDGDALRPPRPRQAHKWSVGSVLIVGGSPGLTGAAVLAGRSALSAGAGAVAVACPGALLPMVESLSAGVMTRGVGEGSRFEAADAGALLEMAERFDVVAIGPGLGPDQDKFVQAVLEGWAGPAVIDADGINALSGPASLANRPAPTVITPHAGEFTRLTGSPANHTEAAGLASATGTVVVLKGSPTFVLGEQRWVVTAGGPELASIGTGDVLTGMLAALWARGLDAEMAARSAAHWHGRAGAALAERAVVTAEGLAAEIGRFAG